MIIYLILLWIVLSQNCIENCEECEEEEEICVLCYNQYQPPDCSECPDNYYEDDNECIRCQSWACKKCINTTGDECSECYDNAIHGDDKRCYCDPYKYKSNACIVKYTNYCHQNECYLCLQSNNKVCEQCKDEYQKYDKIEQFSDYCQCKNNYYLDSYKRICINCLESNMEIQGYFCQCKQNYFRNSQGSCIFVCALNQYYDSQSQQCKCDEDTYQLNNQCIKCQNYCISCTSQNECHKCKDKQQFISKGNCIDCNPICDECKDDQYNCIKCANKSLQPPNCMDLQEEEEVIEEQQSLGGIEDNQNGIMEENEEERNQEDIFFNDENQDEEQSASPYKIEIVFKQENIEVFSELHQQDNGGISILIELFRDIDINQQYALSHYQEYFIYVDSPQVKLVNLTRQFKYQQLKQFHYEISTNQTLHPINITINLTQLGIQYQKSILYYMLIPKYKKNETKLIQYLQQFSVYSQDTPLLNVFIYLGINTFLVNSIQVISQLFLLNYTQPYQLFLFHKSIYNIAYTYKYKLDWQEQQNTQKLFYQDIFNMILIEVIIIYFIMIIMLILRLSKKKYQTYYQQLSFFSLYYFEFKLSTLLIPFIFQFQHFHFNALNVFAISLTIPLFLFLFGYYIFAAFNLYSYHQQNKLFNTTIFKLNEEIKIVEQELNELNKKYDEIIKNRLPYLDRDYYNNHYEIDQQVSDKKYVFQSLKKQLRLNQEEQIKFRLEYQKNYKYFLQNSIESISLWNLYQTHLSLIRKILFTIIILIFNSILQIIFLLILQSLQLIRNFFLLEDKIKFIFKLISDILLLIIFLVSLKNMIDTDQLESNLDQVTLNQIENWVYYGKFILLFELLYLVEAISYSLYRLYYQLIDLKQFFEKLD